MKGEIDGIPFNRCNLCGVDTEENYCQECKEECLKKAGLYLDTLAFEFETELAYESMIMILEGRE